MWDAIYRTTSTYHYSLSSNERAQTLNDLKLAAAAFAVNNTGPLTGIGATNTVTLLNTLSNPRYPDSQQFYYHSNRKSKSHERFPSNRVGYSVGILMSNQYFPRTELSSYANNGCGELVELKVSRADCKNHKNLSFYVKFLRTVKSM